MQFQDLPSFPALVARGTRWCIQHVTTTFLALGALLVLAVLGSWRLALDPSPEAYLKGTKEWETFARIDRTYGIGETIVIALREVGGTVFDTETVRTVKELHRLISERPEVKRVLSLAVAGDLGEAPAGASGDPPPAPSTMASAVTLAGKISGHPLYRRLLVDEKHETTFLLVQLRPDTDPVARLSAVRSIRAEAERFASMSRTVHLAGSAVTKEAIATGVQYDLGIFFPTVFLLLLVLLWIMFGELIASLIPICVVGFSSTLVVGLLGVLGVPINMATASVPILIVVVGLADSVYFLAEARRQWTRTGDREAALVATVKVIALPCLLTSATSAVGFVALVSSRVGPLREFGYGAAVGVVVAHACSLFLTPVLLYAFKYPRDGTQAFVAAPRLGRALTRVAATAGRHLFATVAGIGLLSGACIAAMTRLEINSDFIGYLDPKSNLRRDLQVIEQTLGGADSVEVILTANRPKAFFEPTVLAQVDLLGSELRKLDGVPRVFSFADYVKLAAQVANATSELPATAEELERLAAVDEETRRSLSTPDGSEARLSVQIPTKTSGEVLALTENIQRTTERVLAGTGIVATVTGLPPLFALIVRHLVEDAARSFGLAALLIWLAMAVGMRSIGLATAAMIPTTLPVALTHASMVLLGIPYDTSGAFVACLAIGIAVDNTIHIVARYQKAREQGSPTPATALQYALTYAGHPVILASVLLTLGFSVLCLSSFLPTIRVGLLSAILIVFTLMSDLLLLPVLLIAVDRLGTRFEPEAATRTSSFSGNFKEASSSLLPVKAEEPPVSEKPKPPSRRVAGGFY